MKRSKTYYVLINIIPLLFLVVNVSEIYNAIYHAADYHFGSEAMGVLYKSRFIFISYYALSSLIILLLIASSFSGNKIRYYILLTLFLISLFYPMTTFE